MKKTCLSYLLLLSVGLTLAQTDETKVSTAEDMAHHLRAEYSISKAVYLTQVAAQLSQSFASNEQLQQQWQQALATEVPEPAQYTQINTHALMAQSLIQHTNGMTLNRWRQVDLTWQPTLPPLNSPKLAAQTYNSWANLTHFWTQILTTGGRTNIANWLTWLSLESPAQTPVSATDGLALPAVLSALSTNRNLNQPLSTLPDVSAPFYDELSIALMRQAQHHSKQQFLAMAYDWIEIYQLMELSPSLLTAQEQQQFASLINLVAKDWLANEANINLIDASMHQLVADLLSELPLKFKDPDHINANLNQQIFRQITGINNPSAYFNHPLRQAIQENLEVCLNLSVVQTPEPPKPIDDKQFDSCLTEFVDWGTVVASSANLSSNLIKLDNASSINRALELPSVQIINNLTMQAAVEVNCQQDLSTHSNAVEWLMAAESLAWLHDRWPALMVNNNYQTKVASMVAQGEQIHSYPDCVNQAQPLNTQYQVLINKWERLKVEINRQIKQYSAVELIDGNDVDLFQSVDQQTKFIPQELSIKPCDVTLSCGAFESFKPSAELMNLFPKHLRLSEQFGLGQLSICYDQVQWVNRKTSPTHLDNNKIANFEGQLSIQLNGHFKAEKVFSQTLTSEQRHTYLFGENSQETLDLSCPLPIIGKQIITALDRGTFGLLPNRLTFLTAQKTDINAVLRNNWPQWQTDLKDQSADAFNYYNDLNGTQVALSDAFLHHVNAIQQQIYRKLIANNVSRTNDSALSKAVFEYLTHRKLLASMTTGMYPQLYAEQTAIRSALSGQNRMVDMAFFREAYQTQVNVLDMLELGDENLAAFDFDWHQLKQTGLLIYKSIEQLQQIYQP